MDKATNTADTMANLEIEKEAFETKSTESQTDDNVSLFKNSLSMKMLIELKRNALSVKDILETLSKLDQSRPENLETQVNMTKTLNEMFKKIAETIRVLHSQVIESNPATQKSSESSNNKDESKQQQLLQEKSELIDEWMQDSESTRPDIVNITDVKRAFSDLMKAKIEFDTSFIEFNAVLNQNSENLLSLQDFSADSQLLLGQKAASKVAKRKRSILTLESGKCEGKKPRRSARLQDKCSSAGDYDELNNGAGDGDKAVLRELNE